MEKTMGSHRFMCAVGAISAVLVLIGLESHPRAQQPPPSQVSQTAAIAAPIDPAVGRYFTEAQAIRGNHLFSRHCAYCHSVDPSKPPTPFGSSASTAFLGGALAPRWLARELNGRAIYPSVFYAFKRLEYQPLNNTKSITPQERADILAFLLQKNGLQAGPQELPADYTAMKAMILPAEPGFVHLFNGRDMNDWQFMFGFHCTPPPDGCGQTRPGSVFRVGNDGVLATTGEVHGLMYTMQRYRNYILRAEQRVPVEWDDDDELLPDQTGFKLFLTDPVTIWPNPHVEIEGRYRDLMQLQTGGYKITNRVEDEEARRRAKKRINQWQQMEIVSKDGNIKAYLNGALIAGGDLTPTPPAGYIGLQSQGGPVEWRDIRIKVLD